MILSVARQLSGSRSRGRRRDNRSKVGGGIGIWVGTWRRLRDRRSRLRLRLRLGRGNGGGWCLWQRSLRGRLNDRRRRWQVRGRRGLRCRLALRHCGRQRSRLHILDHRRGMLADYRRRSGGRSIKGRGRGRRLWLRDQDGRWRDVDGSGRGNGDRRGIVCPGFLRRGHPQKRTGNEKQSCSHAKSSPLP